MSQEHIDGADYAPPRGWESLKPIRSSAELWRAYSAERDAETGELQDALEDVLGAVSTAPGVRGPQGAEFRQHIEAAVSHATVVLHKAKKRQRGRDGGQQ